ncbi:lipopolysaccharide biosynthesis protein [Salegentibacter sp. JZCK2]|uniref:lipopolysaccharide biosynthesis protein n=1 Tax=Salegentibacter tibetensis TaxID=2873600 RepID=UPI001CD02FBD|nr:lipopolysaccharide biosynthesis protein [Salegentibacter tibetensis]MBZ9729081.1 lipopolysaccharide biosynthesis protein [Salegentibacter tibetensis]
MTLKKKALTGLSWSFFQQFGNQIIAFAVSVVLARILLPEEFGLIGMISIFIGVGNALMNSGLTQSLIRTDDLDEIDYATVFFYNLGASLLIYVLVFLSAPFIADFYERPILTDIVRLYCLSFIIAAFTVVQQARMTKQMDFKSQALIALPSTVVGGTCGILLANFGYGVWSLVWYELVSSSIRSVQFWIYSKWTPKFVFDIKKFKFHFLFGYKITLSALLGKISDNSIMIIMGKVFSASQVGFYTRAETMKNLPVSNLSMALNRVTYPLFAEIKHNNLKLRDVYQRLMSLVVFVIAPLMVFSAVLAEPLFRFLFTAKWLPAVPYFQILCVGGILYPINMYNTNVLNVKGRSDLFLKVTLVTKGVLILLLFIGLQFGIYGLIIAKVVTTLFAFFLNASYADKFIKYSPLAQLKDLLPIFLLTILTGAGLLYLDNLLKHLPDLFRLVVNGTLGLLFYLGLSYFFKLASFVELIKILRKD